MGLTGWGHVLMSGLLMAMAPRAVCGGTRLAPPSPFMKSSPLHAWQARGQAPAGPSLNPSSSFMPLTLQLDAASAPRLETWWSGLPEDSTHHVRWFKRGDQVKARLSYDFAARLALRQGWGAPWGDAAGQGWRRRFAERMGAGSGVALAADEGMHAAYEPDDTWFKGSPQWALSNPGTTISEIPGVAGYDIHVTPVWDRWGGTDSMVVAIVDAGFNFSHPDLQGRWWVNAAEARGVGGIDDDGNGLVDDTSGWDFVENDADPSDANGHGTEVASIVGASFDNGMGIAGMLPEARILPVRVLDASGHGELADIAAGIQYAVKMGADVINFSIGGDGDSPALKAAFQAARDKGIPVIAAAGNEGANLDGNAPPPLSYGFDNVISVAAVNHAGRFCKFSNYGKQTVDLAAPGEFVLACGVADRVEVFKDDFEADLGHWTLANAGDFRLTAASPLEGKQSAEWVAGANTSLTLKDTVDLRGRKGGVAYVQVEFTPANVGDAFLVEGQVLGETRWQTLGAVGGGKVDQGVSFGLTGFDGKRLRLRLRTSASGSASARKLRFDFVYVSCLNPDPKDKASYPVVAGTSIAAPHVTAYVALLKTACRRMGVPFDRERVYAGTVPDTACAARTRSGGRLDVYKGLEFYLKTLPTLQVIDSTRLRFKPGEKVAYVLQVSGAQVSGAASGWTLSASELTEGGAFDAGTGALIWADGIPKGGTIAFKALARGPTVLRRRFLFAVSEEELPVALVHAEGGRLARARKNLKPGYGGSGGPAGRRPGESAWILGRSLPPASFP